MNLQGAWCIDQHVQRQLGSVVKAWPHHGTFAYTFRHTNIFWREHAPGFQEKYTGVGIYSVAYGPSLFLGVHTGLKHVHRTSESD